MELLFPRGWEDQAAFKRGERQHVATNLALLSKDKKAVSKMEWLPDEEKPQVQTIVDWVRTEKIEIVHAEEDIVHPEYQYSGRPDLAGIWRGNLTIFDFKYAQVCPTEANKVQAESYLKLFKKAKFVFLQVPKENKLTIHRYYSQGKYWSPFLSALNVWRFRHARQAAA